MEKVACWETETHEAETRPSLQSKNLEVQGERDSQDVDAGGDGGLWRASYAVYHKARLGT